MHSKPSSDQTGFAGTVDLASCKCTLRHRSEARKNRHCALKKLLGLPRTFSTSIHGVQIPQPFIPAGPQESGLRKRKIPGSADAFTEAFYLILFAASFEIRL